MPSGHIRKALKKKSWLSRKITMALTVVDSYSGIYIKNMLVARVDSFAYVKNRSNCANVPRLLSMIVGPKAQAPSLFLSQTGARRASLVSKGLHQRPHLLEYLNPPLI